MIPPQSCLLLLVLTLCCSHYSVQSLRDLQVIRAKGTHVIKSDQISVMAEHGSSPVIIRSDVPVSTLRYNDNYYLHGGAPIGQDDMIVVVTSDCATSDLAYVPRVKYGYLDDKSDAGEGTSRAYRPVTSVSIAMTEASVSSNSITNYTSGNVSGNVTVSPEISSQQDLDDLSFLPTSSFWAQWDYTSYWCNENNNVASRNGDGSMGRDNSFHSAGTAGFWQGHRLGLTVAFGLTGLLLSTSMSKSRRNHTFLVTVTLSLVLTTIAVYGLLVEQEGLMTWDGIEEAAIPERYLQQAKPKLCKVNVELLHDGCRFNSLEVTAPTVRIVDVLLQDQENTNDACTTRYQANLTFPVELQEIIETTTTTISRNANVTMAATTILPQLNQWESCNRAVEGRPFIDLNGHPLQASATRGIVQGHGWSTSAGPFSRSDSASTVSDPRSLATAKASNVTNDTKLREALGQEWTQRALAEHASISSFAAFTIALMSNNAPPDLLQDSLTAASDEVRHAKISFEVASYFLGQTAVEPGPLPQSSHRFEQNETALAMATAREGCVDETLSALVAALEVDEQLDHPKMKWLSEEERVWLKDTVRTIAIEEAAHSALAWRTIQWICKTNEMACKSVQDNVLEPSRLEKALELRMQGRSESLKELKEAWSSIYEQLIPVVMENKKLEVKSSDFPAKEEEEDTSGIPLTRLISQMIIQGVVTTFDIVKK